MSKKTLNELTLKDNFMFGAVMTNEENCRKFLNLVLDFPIDKVEVCKEKSMIYHPEYKGIRLDVYAKGRENTHYNIEMQVVKKPALGRRSRYYHSQIDMELLLAGNDYRKLPQVYVIFICDFDPFKQKKYKYTFENRCVEEGKLSLRDGRHTIFLSTRGENGGEISRERKKFLEFVRADLQESQKDFEDDFIKQLQNFIFQVKRDREMEGRFMLLELLLQDERAEGVLEGKREGILELLSDLDTVPEDLENEVESQEDPEVLGIWLKLAARASSLEEFRENIHK